MAKKRFGMNESINKALSQTIQMAEAENSNFINTEILVDRIKLDPANPRNQKITIADLKNGPSNLDPDYKLKEEEYRSLHELSASIQKEGLLHPIVVYKDEEDYRLVAGERRFLATLLAKKTIIDARVFKKKPRDFDLKLIQWIENESRQDVSLYNKLVSVAGIISAYEAEQGDAITAVKLAELISMSRQSAQFYVAILSNKALLAFIKDGRITTLRVAIELSTFKTAEEIEQALTRLSTGEKRVSLKKKGAIDKSKSPGRKRTSIAFGMTKKPAVAKTIVHSVLAQDKFKRHAADFSTTDWTCFNQSTKAFQKLIKLLEKELGVTA